jgi:hypothetical protein
MHIRMILIGSIFLGGCAVLNPTTGCENWSHPDLILTPPAGATLVEERCSSGFNPSYRATFTVNLADLEAFQAVTRVTDWQDTDAGDLVMFTDEAARMSRYLVGVFGDGAYAEEVLIDTTHPEQYMVYYHIAWVD